MRVFVPVYRGGKCIELFKTLFKKYWSGQELVIVPNNTDKYWSNDLIPFFNEIKDEYFGLFLEDCIPVRPVETSVIADCEKMMAHCEKIELSGAFFTREDLVRAETTEHAEFFEVSQTDDYRATLHPCIWKREYFLNLLKPWMTCWDFEVKNAARTKHDGKRVLAVRPYPVGMVNYMSGGKVDKKCFNAFSPEDIPLHGGIIGAFASILYQSIMDYYEIAFGLW
jgi:hypothetical protein